MTGAAAMSCGADARCATAPQHLVHVATSVENAAAGTTIAVLQLAEALAGLGHRVDILTTGSAGSRQSGPVELRSFAASAIPLASHLRHSRGLASAVEAAAASGAVLHTHGLWRWPTIAACAAAHRHGGALVLSTHGMLSPAALSFSRLQKALFDVIVQQKALGAVACFHATSREELDEIRAYGLKAPVAVIANGVEIPEPVARTPKIGGPRTALYLGRLHPIKALDRLLRAWTRVEAKHPDWRLRLVGPSEAGYGEELRRLVASSHLRRVTIDDGLFGEAKLAVLREADLLVLPSHSENFGVVAAEALAAGTPVIASRGTPWRQLETHRCGWWVDNGVESLAAALDRAFALPESVRAEMGERGRAWMARNYSWPRIAAEMADVYRWCSSGGTRPACITV